MRLIALLFLLFSSPASAGDYVADAWGLVAADDFDEIRAAWAGHRVQAGSDAPEMQSPEAPDLVIVFAGPKSLVAGKDLGHVAAIALDRHGNLAEDGTPVLIRIGAETAQTTTRHGISDHIFDAPTRARELTIGAATDQRQSPRAMVRVVADLSSISPTLAKLDETLPYEAFIEISTVQLSDRFGNPIEDGTAIPIILSHEDGNHSLATATALRGLAQARFLSRDIEGRSYAAASLGPSVSEPESTAIALPRSLAEPNVSIEPFSSIEALHIRVGPFLTGDGHALVDGAQIAIHATDRRGKTHQVLDWTKDGYVSALLAIKTPEDIETLFVTSPLGRMDLGQRWTVSTGVEIIE